MYTFNNLPRTVEQESLPSDPLPPWLSSLLSFVVTYTLIALIKLALFSGLRRKREKEEMHIRLYSRRVLLADCLSVEARTLPPSNIEETKAHSVQEDALLVLLSNCTSNLLLRSGGLGNPKRTTSAAKLIDTFCEYLPEQTHTMDGALQLPLQFCPRRRTVLCPIQKQPPINGDVIGVATLVLVGNDRRSFIMQPGDRALDLRISELPKEELSKSPAAPMYGERDGDRGLDDSITESDWTDVCSSSSSGVIVRSQSRLTVEASTGPRSHSTAFAIRSLLDTHIRLADVGGRDHFSAPDSRPNLEHPAFTTLLLGSCSLEEREGQPGIPLLSSLSSTLENAPEEWAGFPLGAESREGIDLRSPGKGAIPFATQMSRSTSRGLDDGYWQGNSPTKHRALELATRTNCDGQAETKYNEVGRVTPLPVSEPDCVSDKAPGAAVQINSQNGARTAGPGTRMLAIDAWLVDPFAPRSYYMLSTWDDETEGEDGSTGCSPDEEEGPGEESMMPGAWLDQEEEREVAELCTRLQDMSLAALTNLLDDDAGTAGSGSESGERVAEVDDSPIFEAAEEVPVLVDAKLVTRLGSIVVESSSLDGESSLELADVASGSDLDASLRHSDWRDGDSDCSAMRGDIDLLGEDEDYVFRPEGECTTPLFDPSDEEDGASVISQNLYYDDETGELFFPFARHARGHGHALLEPLQRPRYHYADTERSLFVVDECERRPMAETVGFDRRGFVFNPFAEDDDDYFEESILEASGASDASGTYPASSTDTQPSTDPGTVSADGTRRTKTRRGCRGGRRGKNRKARRQAALAAGDVGDDIVDPL